MKLETVCCGLCGCSASDRLFEAENKRLKVTEIRFTLRRCRECGLVYTSPRPVAKEMDAFYVGEYYRSTSPPLVNQLNRFFNREHIRWVMRLKPFGKILDVGCGTGGFLAEMSQHGFEIQGVEPSPAVGEVLPESVRGHIHFGTLEEAGFVAQSFDLIRLWHVLEHLPHPLETLKKIRALLKPGGILLAEVPNFESMEARWLGPHWFALDVPRHFWHFTPATLRTLAKRASFQNINVEASVWRRPSLAFAFLLSNGGGIEEWEHERFALLTRWKVGKLALKGFGLLFCLLSRFYSLPVMRLIAHP